MYLTNNQLITKRTETGGTTEQLGTLLEVILGLVKGYGSTAFSERIVALVAKENSELSSLMILLKTIGKSSEKSVRSLLFEAGGGERQSGLSISSPHASKIAEQIGGEQQSVNESEKLQLTVSGDGKIYKRSLDRDLDVMLT